MVFTYSQADHKAHQEQRRRADDERAAKIRADRESISLRTLQQQEQEQERLAKEAAEAPLKQAQAEHQRLSQQLAIIEKNRLLTQPDPDLYIDPATEAFILGGMDKVQEYNLQQFNSFRENTPDFIPGSDTVSKLEQYFKVNGVNLTIHAGTFAAAYEKLKNAGLISGPEADTLEPEPRSLRPSVTPLPVDDGSEWGIDSATGQRVKKTAREIYAMSSDEYKRFARPAYSVSEIFSRQ